MNTPKLFCHKVIPLHLLLTFPSEGNVDFIERQKTIKFEAGTNVRGCGCIELIDDSQLENSETFEVTAVINDPVLSTAGDHVTSVIIYDNTDSEYVYEPF